MPASLEARGLGFQTGRAVLLHDVNLSAASGEVLAVVGPNGAGKSTLLRLLAGEIAPTSGDVLLDGASLRNYAPAALALRRAVLPQQTVLQFSFKAREVVIMGRNPHLRDGWPSHEDGQIAMRAMQQTETEPFALRAFPSLSGGEQSRVTMARVLAQKAPILLLDEPTSSLDVRHQEQIMRTARRLAGEGACVIVILHDLNLAAAYADRLAVLQHGTLAACGTPAEVLQAELLSGVFDCDLEVIENAGRVWVAPRRS